MNGKRRVNLMVELKKQKEGEVNKMVCLQKEILAKGCTTEEQEKKQEKKGGKRE